MAEPTVPDACPVAALARLERTFARLCDRIDTLEGQAAQTRAASAEGALFQLALALADAGLLADMAHGACATDAVRRLRRVEGLLWSVARLLEGQAGVGLREVAGAFYVADLPDPHAALDEARQGAD